MNANNDPILSIVIANYNYGRFLDAAIKSVVEQDGFNECELIIVDGGSSDNSVDIIKKYQDRIYWWVSEPDKGQSDAFNKGFGMARGRYLTWLNADDVFCQGCLRRIVHAMHENPECEWFTGNMLRFLNDGRIIEIGWGPHFYPYWMQTKNAPIVVYGPATFFSKKIYNEAGGFDVNLHHTMDYDLWLKFTMKGIKQKRINCFCWAFRMHVASKTAEFGDHLISPELRERAKKESVLIHSRAGYRLSRFRGYLLKFWRVLDGSAIRGLLYKLTKKKFLIPGNRLR